MTISNNDSFIDAAKDQILRDLCRRMFSFQSNWGLNGREVETEQPPSGRFYFSVEAILQCDRFTCFLIMSCQ